MFPPAQNFSRNAGDSFASRFDADSLQHLMHLLQQVMHVRPVPLEQWAEEIRALYRDRHINTRSRMFQALREVEALAPADATTEVLTPALVDQFGRRVGRASTTNGLLASLRVAVRVGVERGYFPGDLVGRCRWHVPDRGPRPKRHFSRAEVARVLEHLAARTDTWRGQRLHALFAVLAYCGLRASEAYYLRVEDIDLERRIVFVRSDHHPLKTEGSEAPVPMPEVLVPILRAWLARCGSVWLFPRTRGDGPWYGGSLGSRPGSQIRAAAEAAGVMGMTPRSLRHSLATHLAGWHGLSSKQIRLVLRHTTDLTQAYYVHPDVEDLRASVRDFTYAD